MSYSYVIINDNQENVLSIQGMADGFQSLHFAASANNYDDGLNAILEYQPQLVFLEIDPKDKASKLSLSLINELYRYLKTIPKIVVTAKNGNLALEAIKHEVFDYLVAPFELNDFRKTVLKFEKSISLPVSNVPTETIQKPLVIDNDQPLKAEPEQLTICIKSYGDYRFIDAKDILYFQADNNSTDIHLNNGEMITAFKTLKHFENVLPSQFYRIHNSYIVNINYVSRIHTGNTVCYIKNTTTKLPFSKSYKANVDQIIAVISSSNYLEI
jgi:Response regulator of the LytR/AlgR family